ncbi:MAG: hypothetical protein U5J82_15670 [Desulfobacterales bacterium]|nr:hypothetical protein [Desulfobacterales bacterium]
MDGEIDPQVGAQKQVGLARLHRDAHRRAVAVEIPGTRQDIVLGHHAAGAQGALGAAHRNDPVHQHQRRVGQAHPHPVAVDRGKFGSQHAGHGAHRKLHAHLAGIGRRR